jgi:hypothetical protein
MITTRPELSYPVFKLSHFDTSPATITYDAVYGMFQYLSGTRDGGLTYTRPDPLTWGPVMKRVNTSGKAGAQIPQLPLGDDSSPWGR